MFSIPLDIKNALAENYLNEAFSLDYALLSSHFGVSYLGPCRVKYITCLLSYYLNAKWDSINYY
jgi:hypothetical protein